MRLLTIFTNVKKIIFLYVYTVTLSLKSYVRLKWFCSISSQSVHVYRCRILGGMLLDRIPNGFAEDFFPTEFDSLKYLGMSAIALGR